jgi:flavin reductase (DIM6/NTAB) family NADH-FMN oxidoreductase RutF
MKKDFLCRPDAITEKRCLDYGGFSWQEFTLAIPEPVFVVTGRKANGRENASLQSWATFASGGIDDFICIMGCVNKNGHMYASLKETGVCVLNFASGEVLERCVHTIKHNAFDDDEITAAGLTAEPALKVNAPRIKECFLNIECEFLWEHPLCEGSDIMTVAVRALCLSAERSLYAENGRYGRGGYPVHIHCPINPETGEETPGGFGFVTPDETYRF